MAWKRSPVRSRSGPPTNYLIFNELQQVLQRLLKTVWRQLAPILFVVVLPSQPLGSCGGRNYWFATDSEPLPLANSLWIESTVRRTVSGISCIYTSADIVGFS